MLNQFKPMTCSSLAALIGLCAAMLAAPASAQAPSWAEPGLVAAAKAEGGTLTVYGSMNEQEALPYYKVFEDATGIKVSYVRASDTALFSRISIEYRARQRTWDLVVTTPVNRLPDEVLLQFDPAEAKNLMPQARGPNRRWYGVYANYNSPGYNTNLVKKEDLPKTYEDFLTHKEWVGKIAIDKSDTEWLSALYEYYGEQKGRKLAQDIATTLKPVLTDGHLALARSVARRRIRGGAQQLYEPHHQHEALRRAERLLGARSGGADLRLGRHQHPGAASQVGAAGVEFRAQPRGADAVDQGGPPADAARRGNQSAGRDESAQSEESAGRRVLGR